MNTFFDYLFQMIIKMIMQKIEKKLKTVKIKDNKNIILR